MISTYHVLFLVALAASVVFLVLLLIYIPVFHVPHAILWLTGIAKRKEMRSYSKSGMSVTGSRDLKKKKKKPESVTPPASGIASENLQDGKNEEESSRAKESTTEEFTDKTEGYSSTNLFYEESGNVSDKNSGTDIFSENDAGTDIFTEEDEQSRETDLFDDKDPVPEGNGTDLFEETEEIDLFKEERTVLPRGTDLFEDIPEENGANSADVLGNEKGKALSPDTELFEEDGDDDEIFLSVGSAIPDSNADRGTELFED